MRVAHMESPIGTLLLKGDGEHLTEIVFAAEAPSSEAIGLPSDSCLDEAKRQLAEYFAGTRTEFDLPLAPEGTAFQKNVWKALSQIPFGESVCYEEIAKAIGVPTAARAVGAANGRNPLPIVVPCHRVVGKRGDLVGYAGGLGIKRFLLEHERSILLGNKGTDAFEPVAAAQLCSE